MPFTPEDIRRLIANPYYAIAFNEELIDREPVEHASDWLARATTALEVARGRGRCTEWMEHLLAVLRDDAAAADPSNPARAVRINETFAIDHPPLLTEATWVAGNCNLVTQHGARAWLTTLLRVLGGEIVTADDVSDDVGLEDDDR
jgi:hypothetical protein